MHAGQNATDAIAFGAELPHGDGQAPRKLIERATELGELVGAAESRARIEIALRHRVGDMREVTNRARRELRREKRHRDGDHEREERAEQQCAPELRLRVLDGRERKRDTREAAAGHHDRDVEEPLVHGVAQSRRGAATRVERVLNLGPLQMIFDGRDSRELDLRVAEDAPIGRDERDARLRSFPEVVGERIPLRDVARRKLLELGLSCDERDAHEQIVANAIGEERVERLGEVRVRDDDRDDDDRDRCEEKLRSHAETPRRARARCFDRDRLCLCHERKSTRRARAAPRSS